MTDLTALERALLDELEKADGRVLGRAQLTQLLSLQDRSPRRVDSLLTNIRRYVGPDVLVTVRGRGWRLDRK